MKSETLKVKKDFLKKVSIGYDGQVFADKEDFNSSWAFSPGIGDCKPNTYAIGGNRLAYTTKYGKHCLTIPTDDIIVTLEGLNFDRVLAKVIVGYPISNKELFIKMLNLENVYKGILAEDDLSKIVDPFYGYRYAINISGEPIQGWNSNSVSKLEKEHYYISPKNGLLVFKDENEEIYMGYNITSTCFVERLITLGYKEGNVNMPDEKFYLANEHLQGKLDLIKTIKKGADARKKLNLAKLECIKMY